MSTMYPQLYTSHFSLNDYTISCTEKVTYSKLEYDMIEWKVVLQYLETFK